MRRVEQVTGKPQSDIEKMAIFLNHFDADSRPGVAVRIATLVLIKATYEVMYKSVCETYPIEETPHHRALLVTKSTELCRRHGLGTSPHSAADCRHIHKGKAGAFALKLTGKPPGARTPPSPQPTGSKPYPNHIAERHSAAIGILHWYCLGYQPYWYLSQSSQEGPRPAESRALTHGPQARLLTRAALPR
jgi:hypothetical protein